MHYKRRRKYSRMAQKCTICAGKRRTFGRPDKEKKLDRIEKKEIAVLAHR